MKEFLQSKAVILVVLTVAILLRLPLLDSSFWLDEAAQAIESTQPLSQLAKMVEDFQPPLMTILVHFLLFFSRAEWWLRLGGALVPGIITVWATYQIGKKMFGQRAGIAASALLATSSFHIFYSQELRPYAMPAMFASISWWVIYEWKKAPKNSHFYFLSFLILSICGMYSSYMYLFLLLSQLSYVFFTEPKLRRQVVAIGIGSGIAFMPWLPVFFNQLRAGQLLQIQLPGWKNIVGFDQVKSLGLIVSKFVFGVVHVEINLFFGIVMFALTTGFIYLFVRYKFVITSKKFWLVCFWLLLPIFLAWLISFFIPILQPKRVLFCLPALYLFIAGLIFPTKEKIPAWQYLLFALLLSINIFSTVSYYLVPKYQREDWRSLHEEITTKYPHSSIVVFSFPEAFAPWRWYDNGVYPVFATGTLSMKNMSDLSSFKKLTEYRYVLVFDYLRDLTDPGNSILTQLQKYGYQEVGEITPKTQLGFVRVYARKETVVGLKTQ